jgi:excisionase family DNA binding protein
MNATAPAVHAQSAPVLPSVWLTANEAAAYLRVSPRTIVEWAREGKIKGHVLSGTQRHTWRFRTVDLDEMMVSPAVLQTERRPN